jgi:hypothetical protein
MNQNNDVRYVGLDVYHETPDTPLDTFLDWLSFYGAYVSSGVPISPLTAAMTPAETLDVFQEGMLNTLYTVKEGYTLNTIVFLSKMQYLLDNLDPVSTSSKILVQVKQQLDTRIVLTTLKSRVFAILNAMKGEMNTSEEDLDETLPFRKESPLTPEEAKALSLKIDGFPYSTDLKAEWKNLVISKLVTTTSEFTTKVFLALQSTLLPLTRGLSNSYNTLWSEVLSSDLPEDIAIQLEGLKYPLISEELESDTLASMYTLCTVVNDFVQNTPISDKLLRKQLIIENLSLRKATNTIVKAIEVVQASEGLINQPNLTLYSSALDKASSTVAINKGIVGGLLTESNLNQDNSLTVQSGALVEITQIVSHMNDLTSHVETSTNVAAYIISQAEPLQSIDSESKTSLSTSLTHVSKNTYKVGQVYEELSEKQESLRVDLNDYLETESSVNDSVKESPYWSRIETSYSATQLAMLAVDKKICELRNALNDLTCLLSKIGIYDSAMGLLKSEEDIDATANEGISNSVDSAKAGVKSSLQGEINQRMVANSQVGVKAAQDALNSAFPDNPEVYGLLMKATLLANQDTVDSQPSSILDSAESVFNDNLSKVTSCVEGQVANLFNPLDPPCSVKGSTKLSGLNIPKRNLALKLRVASGSRC